MRANASADLRKVSYAAAKGGVNALTASIAMEQSLNGIRINADYLVDLAKQICDDPPAREMDMLLSTGE